MATSKTRENNFQSTVNAYLKTLPGCRVIKNWAGPYSEAGVSDDILCYEGYFIAIELKAPGTIPGGICSPLEFHPTDLRERNQVQFQKEIIETGGIAFFCSSLEALRKRMEVIRQFVIEKEY